MTEAATPAVPRLEGNSDAELDDTLPKAVVRGVVVVRRGSYYAGTAGADTGVGCREIRVIQTVQSVEADLEISGFTRDWEFEILAEREIDIFDAGSAQDVS